jgi:hypothetical protein
VLPSVDKPNYDSCYVEYKRTKETPSTVVSVARPFNYFLFLTGFCIKTREVGSERKFFVNICHTDAIPAPKDISEKELSEILESDEISEFRVPMSIGEVRTEKDKKNEEAKAADVAVHPSFFNKIEQSQLFKSFFITIVFEGLKDKYGIVCNDEKIILKNRKAFGTLQMHRIQQREVDEKMKSGSRSLIEEITGSTGSEGAKPLIETISSNSIENRVPEYRLFRRKAQPNCLVGEFKFPDVVSFNLFIYFSVCTGRNFTKVLPN